MTYSPLYGVNGGFIFVCLFPKYEKKKVFLLNVFKIKISLGTSDLFLVQIKGFCADWGLSYLRA